jgi:hypothetical protein
MTLQITSKNMFFEIHQKLAQGRCSLYSLRKIPDLQEIMLKFLKTLDNLKILPENPRNVINIRNK